MWSRLSIAIRRHAELVRLAIVLAIGIGLASIYAFPGYMAWDSVEQLAMARSGVLTDWHPPIMSALWGVLDRIVAGPALMFVLQCTLFLVGLYVLLRRRMSGTRAVVATLVIFVFPASLSTLVVIVKDSLMCGALLAGCAGLTSARRSARIAGLVAFFFAAALRHNALAIVVPLVALLSPWWPERRRIVRLVAGGAVGIALVLGAFLVNRALTDVHTHPFHYSVAPMDIVGTLHFADELGDDEIRTMFQGVPFVPREGLQAYAHRRYDPNRWWGEYLFYDDRLFDEPKQGPVLDAITSGWWRMVRSHPGAYALWRLDLMRNLLALHDGPMTPVYAAQHEAGMLAGTYQPPMPRNDLQKWLSRRMVRLGKTSLMFRPYVYLVIAIALAIVLRRDRVVMALLASIACHLLLLLLVSPSPDYRYAHWPIVAVLFGVAVRLLGARPASQP